jgi:uncharacterized cupin superfamily protein
MADSTIRIVKTEDVPWDTFTHGEHFASASRGLTGGMPLGANIERLAPGKVSCPLHYHLREDEFFLVLRGRAMLRTTTGTIEVREGDAISCPAGEGSAHQFFNHTDEPTDILMVGRNSPDDACYYPDSGKWMIRALKKIGRVTETDYMDGEPDPPIVKR